MTYMYTTTGAVRTSLVLSAAEWRDLCRERNGTIVAVPRVFMLNYGVENLIITYCGPVVCLVILVCFFGDTKFF